MSLLKLWNSIRGRGNEDAESGAVETASAVGSSAETNGHKASPEKAEQASKTAGAVSKVAPSAKRIQGKNAALCNLIKKSIAADDRSLRVLEIGVGDGSRSADVLRTLMSIKPAESIHYSAVDTFEMGDGPISLRDFNRLLRGLGVHPQLFPMPVVIGLTRLAHTVGQVDLILDSQSFHESADAGRLLSKLSRTGTLWLAERGGRWDQVDVGGPINDSAGKPETPRRAA